MIIIIAKHTRTSSAYLIPNFEEKSTMIRLVHQWLGVVTIMLKGCVYKSRNIAKVD